MLKTLKGRTALAAAVLAAVGIALVTSLQSKLSEHSVIASTVAQHEDYTARMAGEVDSRLLQARASLSEFASTIPGGELQNATALHYYLTTLVGIHQAFESISVYDVAGNVIASRPSSPMSSIAREAWFDASLRNSVIGPPTRSSLSQDLVVPMTYRVYDEAGVLRGVAVGMLPVSHEQLFGAARRNNTQGIEKAHGNFVLVSRNGQVMLHPDAERVGQSIDALGKAASVIHSGLRSGARSVEGPDSQGARSLYAFHPIHSTDWTLIDVVSTEEAYASLDRLSRRMLLTGALLALLMFPAMWMLVARMLLPLDALRRDMRRLKEGAGVIEPGLAGRNATQELQQLAEEFAGMAAARREAESSLLQEKERAEVTLQSIGDAVLATDRDGRITAMNRAAERLTGWSFEEAQGRPFAEVAILCDEAGEPASPALTAAAMDKDGLVTIPQALLRTRDHALLPVDNSAAPIHSAGRSIDGAVAVLRNVAAERAAAQQLLWQASHDAMTGLMNRAAYDRELKRLVDTLQDQDRHSVVMIDLDKFKIVNDTCGHAAGDELLKQLAALFLATARKTDLVARLGGDEFAILMYQCPSDNAMLMAEKLRRSVDEWSFEWNGQVFRIGASIGLVSLDRSFSDPAAVQKAADMACYAAKRSGRNRVCLHVNGEQAAEDARDMQGLDIEP